MNRNFHAPAPERGSALAVVLLVLIIVAALSMAMLKVILGDHEQTEDTVALTRLGYIVETGAAHALSDLATGGGGSLGSESSPVAFGRGGYWTEATDNGDGTWTILSRGRINGLERAMEVVLAPVSVPLFTKALFGDLDLAAKGSVFTDSYDSDITDYASQAVNTDPFSGRSYAGTNGSLASNGNIYINGSVVVLGDATPGPGKGVYINGGNAYVAGSTTAAPTVTPLPPIDFPNEGTSDTIFSTSSDALFTAGEYHYESFEARASAEVRFQGDVTLYVDEGFDVSGQAEFIVEAGSTVAVYHAGTDFSLTGGGMINQSGKPSSFRLYSKATSVKFGGNSTFHGAVYAPLADIDPGGTTEIFGSFVGRQVTVNGTADFHYDEALSKSPDSVTFLRPVSWRRIGVRVAP